MKTHELVQGSPEWLAYRVGMYNASDASAMLGLSKNTKRTELLYILSTGLSKEFSDYVQRMVLDKGHEVEAMARPIIEALIGDDLWPVVGSRGKISASCDGLTMDDSIAFEHKQWNGEYAEMVRAGELPKEHWPQCQQVLYVTGAKKLIFVISDGTENNLSWMWVYPDKAKQDLLLASWAQFEKDLAVYEPYIETPAPVADAIISLPSVIVQVKGELTACNFNDIRKDWDEFIANAVVNLIKDDDFTRAEAESKEARSTAKKCLAVVKGVIEQTLSISQVTRELELYAEKFNALALKQEKLVKSQKEARKLAIMTIARLHYAEHLKALELEITPIKLITGQPDFNGVMKNKRLLSAIQDAVDTELAMVKIEADGVAKLLRDNLKLYREYPAYFQLFADLQTIIYKPFDDFKLIIESRVEAHKKAENEKLAAQRIAIEAEATRKAEAEQAVKLEAECQKVRDEEQARINEERRLELAKQAPEIRQPQCNINMPLEATDPEKEIEPPAFKRGDIKTGFESITIPLSEYDALKADSERLHAIIANWVMAKSMNESALRANDNYTKEKERMAAMEMRQKAIDLIELK